MMPYAFMVKAHLHLLLLLSVESINHEKCLHRLQFEEASRIHKTAKYCTLISPVDYTSYDDALGYNWKLTVLYTTWSIHGN
jgi:hypothetical protein